MTMYELHLKTTGYNNKIKREQDNYLYLAWNIHINNPYVKKHLSFDEFKGGKKESKTLFERLRMKQAALKLKDGSGNPGN